MKCNRGDRLVDLTESGISVFTSSSKPTLKTLTKAIEMLREKQKQSDFYENLDTMLKLECVPFNDEETAFVHRKDQKVGNCTFATAKTILAALLFAEFRTIPGGLTFAAKFYKIFTAFDRLVGLETEESWSTEYPEAAQKAHLEVARRPLSLNS